MDDALKDLISRLSRIVNDPLTRPLLLHWSDVELLKVVQDEILDQRRQLNIARKTILELFVYLNATSDTNKTDEH